MMRYLYFSGDLAARLFLALVLMVLMFMTPAHSQEPEGQLGVWAYCLETEPDGMAKIEAALRAGDDASYISTMMEPGVACFDNRLLGRPPFPARVLERGEPFQTPAGHCLQISKIQDMRGTVGHTWLKCLEPPGDTA